MSDPGERRQKLDGSYHIMSDAPPLAFTDVLGNILARMPDSYPRAGTLTIERDDEHWFEWRFTPDDWMPCTGDCTTYPECDTHVQCDDDCLALLHPETKAELHAALEHWRYHGYLSGCSHAC